jgi:hypothetical protein
MAFRCLYLNVRCLCRCLENLFARSATNSEIEMVLNVSSISAELAIHYQITTC